MRTSGQLRRTDACEHNPHANISVNNSTIKEAVIQKNVILRALMGEPIEDYRVELMNAYDANDKVWENEENRASTLALQTARLERFIDWETHNPDRQSKLFKTDINGGQPLVVNYFGEEIEAKPDYVVDTESAIYVCKIKTGRYRPLDDESMPEAYCLGLAGEAIREDLDAQNKPVIVQYLYLGDGTAKDERASLTKGPNGAYVVPYDTTSRQYNKISELIFDERMKEQAREVYAKTDHSACSPEQCANCSMNNICHYEEPPISHSESEIYNRDWAAIESSLSYDQRAVRDFNSGTLRVNAGPGSGKTLVTSVRVGKLIESGVDPEKICVLTFTNAGAGEMTERAVDYLAYKGLPCDPAQLTSTTFNAFCQQIINEHYEDLGYTRKPRIVPDETKRAIINRILDQFPKMSCWTYSSSTNVRFFRKDTTKVAFAAATREFEKIKKEGYTRNNYDESWDRIYKPEELDMLFLMYDEFNQQLKAKDMMEFDDQILGVNKLYQMHPDLFEQMGYEHIIVDEFQDTDLAQIKLLQKMRDTTCFRSLMCVGDDSQSIFAFRHTSPEYMVNFGDYFGHHENISLVENHRSNRKTIDFANKINDMALSKVDKTLIATKPDGNEVDVQGFYTKKQEYEYIAQCVKSRWEAGNHDIAVIMSNRNQLTAIADELTKIGVPSTLKSPVLVTQNSRVCALTTFYDSFMGRSTQGFLDYKNVIEHGGLKGKSGEELEEIAEEFRGDVLACEKTIGNFVAFAKALDVGEVDECYQDFLEKVEACRDMDELTEFMEDFKLYGANSTYKREGRYDGVCLTTIHSSKGLEWDTTFLCMDELDDVKYHERPNHYQQTGEYDEQIRKWFVGSTRAREELIMTGQAFLSVDNKNCATIRNQFLEKAYELSGKFWGFCMMGYNQAKEEEKQAAIEETVAKSGGFSVNGARVSPAVAKALSKHAVATQVKNAPKEEKDTPVEEEEMVR